MWSPNRFILWNDHTRSIMAQLEFKTTDIKNIQLTRDRIIVLLSHKIYLYTLSEHPQKLATIDTWENPFGNILSKFYFILEFLDFVFGFT